MNYSSYRFTLDLHKHQSQMSIPVFLGDTAVRLYISLTDGGNPYIIEDGCRAVLMGRKPSLNPDQTRDDIWIHDCIIESNAVIRYDFTDQTANVAGTTQCELRLYGTDGRLVTAPRFIIVVDERVIWDDEIPISETDLQALDKIFAASTQIPAILNTARDSATTAQRCATEAQASATAAQGSATEAKASENNAADKAELAEYYALMAQEIVAGINPAPNPTPSVKETAIHGTFTLSETDIAMASMGTDVSLVYMVSLEGLGENGALIVEPKVDSDMSELEYANGIIKFMELADSTAETTTIGIILNDGLTQDITFEYVFIPTATNGKRLFYTAIAGKASAIDLDELAKEVEELAAKVASGVGGGSGNGEYVEKEELYSKEPNGEYEDVQVATLPIDAFSLRKDSVWGDTALIEVEPSGTYVLSFDSCIEHTGSASLFLNEYTENNEQVVTDERLSFEAIGTSTVSHGLVASVFPNGGRCTITVGSTIKYIKLAFNAYYGSPERLPSGLTLTYNSPIMTYGGIKVEKLPTKVVSSNLFNKATASTGKNVYLGKNSNGEPLYGWYCILYDLIGTETSSSGFDSTSSAIEVEGGQTYFKSDGTIINFFDRDDVWINHPRPDTKAVSFVTPDNAKYLRIGFISTYIDKLQLVKGDKALPYDEWKIGIEGFDSDKSPQINEVLSRNALQYPFMQEYMWEIAEEAHKYTAPDRHTFIFVSDTHAKVMSDRTMSAVANMTKYVPCSCAIHGGDIIDGISPKANELLLLTTLVRNGNEAKCPVYYVKGNHDWNILYRSMINTSATADEYILNSELARRTNCFDMKGVHGDVKNMYFYVDNEVTKIRTIIFNCVNKDESGNLLALNNNAQAWGAEQIQWLINDALNFKDVTDKAEWGVVFIQHQMSGSSLWSVLNGFKNGTSGTTSGADGENLSISFDFTTQGAMNLIANFVGDIHYDAVEKAGTTPVISIVNASLANDYADGHAPSSNNALLPSNKVFGTENETAFDIVTIDKKNHLIYLTRYGARSYAYNSATGKHDKIAARTRVVDYSTGDCTVITEE